MPENNQNNNQYEVTTNEIMDYLKDSVPTKEDLKDLRSELRVDLNKQKLEIIDRVDEKLADLKGDLVILMRKVITASEAKGIFQMEPFPQLII